jgi:hypothetical protein
MRAVLLALAALASGWPGWVGADSACFVERELLGKQADGWLWGGAQAGAGPVRLYTAQGTALAAAEGCEALDFQRWPCDTEHAFLPIERSTRVLGLARAKLRSGAEVWVRPEQLGLVVDLMSVGADGRSGRLLPDAAPIRRTPSTESAAFTARDSSAAQRFIRAHQPTGGNAGEFVRVLKAEATAKNEEGDWLQVSEHLVYTPDDGLTQVAGPLLRTGYLLHRDRRGVVKAVIEPLWCD